MAANATALSDHAVYGIRLDPRYDYDDAELNDFFAGWEHAVIDTSDRAPVVGDVMAVRTGGVIRIGRVSRHGPGYNVSGVQGIWFERLDEGWYGRVMGVTKSVPRGGKVPGR